MQNLNHCGCCEGLSAETPVQVQNRPGLKAITYRVGNQSQFRESLLARLTTSGLRPLRALTTRDQDDFTIALLDAWATVADVLTFYQERIANESYLGTATEQLSVLELARLIGYELRPGVAAGAYFAFTVDENAGAVGQPLVPGSPQRKAEPPALFIEPGIKVQSIPGPEEEAQTFETVEPIEARPEWNVLKPRLTQPQLPIADNSIVVLKGTDNDLKAGDILLIRVGLNQDLTPKKILKTIILEESKTTCLYLDAAPTLPAFDLPAMEPTGEIRSYPDKVDLNKTIAEDIISQTWTEEDLAALIQAQGWSVADLKESILKELAAQASSDDVIYVFRKRASVFGYNAVLQTKYNVRTRVPLPQSQWDEWPLSPQEAGNKLYLDTAYEQVLPGSYIVVQKPADSLAAAKVIKADQVDIRPRTDYGLSARSTLITLPSGQSWYGETGKDLSFLRGITILAQSVPLVLAESPIPENVSGDTVMLERLYIGLKKGKTVILFGDRADLPGVSSSELKVLKEVFVVKGITVLVFDKPLAYAYLRTSVSINANVAAATHGEKVKETLGSGDAARSFQKFLLKQPPLTFISAATPSGTKSTLEIRVNDLLWYEVPSLYGHGPGEHIYITRQDDQARTTVIFGDGINGARLPTGPENIRATYRKGIGLGGLLKAHQLSQLITRPLGVKGVTNPLKTSGAEDREQLADARRNATLTIFTLGRIVSLQDYEDFARSFAGISKSLATWTWTGQRRSVYLTVAGYNGAVVEDPDPLYQNLLSAILAAGIPEVPVTIASYQPRFFRLRAKIQVHPDYLPGIVIAAVEQQLREQFSFAAREFGQTLAFSKVMAVMQNVEGVTAVDMDELYRSGEPAGTNDRLYAAVPRPGREKPFPAELLTLDAKPLDLKVML